MAYDTDRVHYGTIPMIPNHVCAHVCVFGRQKHETFTLSFAWLYYFYSKNKSWCVTTIRHLVDSTL